MPKATFKLNLYVKVWKVFSSVSGGYGFPLFFVLPSLSLNASEEPALVSCLKNLQYSGRRSADVYGEMRCRGPSQRSMGCPPGTEGSAL